MQAQADVLIDWQKAQQLYTHCSACHGIEGNIENSAFPKLAGQNPRYVNKQLQDYQTGKRIDPIMTPIAKGLSDTDMHNLLAYMGSFKRTAGNGVDPKWLLHGEKLYRMGAEKQGIPACAACHGPSGLGNNEALFPALAAQNNGYIIEQLQAFQNQKRQNDPNQMMQTIAAKLSDQDKQAVASFINGLHE